MRSIFIIGSRLPLSDSSLVGVKNFQRQGDYDLKKINDL
jgi:hypothetical protein